MNPFDAAVALCLIVAVVMGYRAGLLRSLATIFGYLAAAPVAVAFAPRLAPLAGVTFDMAQASSWLLLFGFFFVAGVVLSAFFRAAVSAAVGEEIGVPDRFAGAALGAVRVGLLAVLMVLIFDRIIPANRQPPFLAQSRLRPFLSAAGHSGLRSLSPEVVAQIDRLKKAHGI